jgi:ElaB/YqjD/DUF883 family membrane-anchored ribosome-binding protein
MESNAQEFSTRRSVAPMPAPDSADLDQLTRDFRVFVSDCETLLKNAATLSGSGAAVARAQLSEKMSVAKTRFDEMRTTAGDRAVRARSATKDYVRREPLMSIGAAAVAGAILGMMLSRR